MTDDETKDDDGIETIRLHVRQGVNAGENVACTQGDMDSDDETLSDLWSNTGFTGPYVDFMIDVRKRRPRDAVVEAVVDIPDAPSEPASASVAA